LSSGKIPIARLLEPNLSIDALTPAGIDHVVFRQADPFIIIDLALRQDPPWVAMFTHISKIQRGPILLDLPDLSLNKTKII
jgi:hypothetical protein